MTRLNSGFAPPYSQQATGVVRDGIRYISTGQQDVFALNAKTGSILWEYRSTADPSTPNNKAKRAVALGEGMVFGVEMDIRKQVNLSGESQHFNVGATGSRTNRPEPVTFVFVFDQRTGKVLWKHEVGEDVPKEVFLKYITALRSITKDWYMRCCRVATVAFADA